MNFLPIPADNYLFIFKYNSNNKDLTGINKFCILIKKSGEDYMIYIPAIDNMMTTNYAIQFFIYFDLQQKYYIFNFRKKD